LSGGFTQQTLQGAHVLLTDLRSLSINHRIRGDTLLVLSVGVLSRYLETLCGN
jgi:hypothetical protein